MNKQKKILPLMLVMIVIAWSLSACVTNPARKPINDDANNYRINNLDMTTPYTAQNNQNNNNTTNNRVNDGFQTSSLFSKLDYSYATIIPSSINVRSGPSADGNIVANLKTGDKVKVIGKLNGWYVINIPNTTKVGCISPNYAKLYSAQPASTAPTATKPIPKTTTPASPGTTPGANTGTNANTGNTGMAANTPTATGTGTLSSQGARILQLANAERAKVGAKPLKANTDLNKLASMKSQDIVDNNYFSHQSPTYGSPFDMMKTYGISYMYAGENLAINNDADAAHNAWMNSEGHKRNILNPDFTELGIGLYPKGNGSYAYTQMFIGK
ncbi:MAG: CAP domain-containing protein [Lutisporaceae bacterium]